jgi:uncharacterized protein YcbK (DUF882 family)
VSVDTLAMLESRVSFELPPARRNVLLGAAAAGAAALGLSQDTLFRPAKPAILRLAKPIAAPQTTSVPPVVVAPPPAEIRRVALHNLHTGDKLDAVYWENGAYVPSALAQVQRVMRDWRNGAEHFMDPKLFDVMNQIALRLDTKAPFEIISGYRSPATNAMLHNASSGVATNSQHTHGKASDIRIPGVELAYLHKAALSLQAGGVGYYPVSNFVHVDVARVRSWKGV